jgi:type I restriction enzyme S subunit
LSKKQVKVNKSDWYYYAEIGDINVATGGITFHKMRGYQLPTNRPLAVKPGDVLISTVRTYRKGIGYCSFHEPNLVTTNAVMNFCDVTDYVTGLTCLYVYSFLRSDFFVEQVWSMLNRGIYPRMDKGALDKITIPIPSDSRVIRYVSVLMRAIVDKEKTIREKNSLIDKTIGEELFKNQKSGGKFSYSLPPIKGIRELGRLDAGMYSEDFKRKQFLITNYERGYADYENWGFEIGRGQNLQISCIGESIYSDEAKPNFYRLVAPTDISEYRTVQQFRYLGNKRELSLLKQGDVVFGAEGFCKGRTVILADEVQKTITNIHGIIFHPKDGSIIKGIFLGCFLGYLRSIGLVDAIGAGGSGGSLAIGYFHHVPIPKFSVDKQSEIARLYQNQSPPPPDMPRLDTFVDWHRRWNAALGIWELDREMKALQRTLTNVQEQIIEGKTVTVPV